MTSMHQDSESNFIENNINLGRAIRVVLMQSKLFILITFLFFALGISYYLTAPKIYKISSLVQVYSNQPSGFGDSYSLDFALGGSGAEISTTVSLYKTRFNVLEVINKLSLNITSDDLDHHQKVKFNKFVYKESNEDLFFFIEFGELNFDLFDEDKLLISSIEYDKDFNRNGFNLNIEKPSFTSDELLKFRYRNPEKVIKSLSSRIEVLSSNKGRNSFYKKDDLLTISILTEDIEEGKMIIDLANQIFINQSLKGEKEKASKAIQFIDQRIESTNNLLELSKDRLKIFREQNKSINVDLEIESIINSIATIDAELSKLDLEITEAENLYTANNPIYLNLNQKKTALTSQKVLIESKIKDLPLAQQRYIDLYRDVEITEELYVELINKKLTYSILEASTIGNIRVIDGSYNDGLVSPMIFNVFLITFTGFLLSIVVTLLRGIYF